MNDDDLVARLAECGADPEAMAALLGPVLTRLAPLTAKAVWVARQVAETGAVRPPVASFAADWLSSWARFYVTAAQVRAGAGAAVDDAGDEPTLWLTWHHPAYPLLLRPLGATSAVVLLAQPCEWMSTAAGPGNTYCFRDTGPPRWLFRDFARGRPVAAMIDYCYDETSAVVAPFLGRPARTPIGVLALAARFGFRVRVLSWSGTNPMVVADIPAADAAPAELAAAVNTAISREIAAAPASWLLWPSLDRRWSPR